MTAQELAATMLRQQAEQIESLKAECETRKAYGDEQTEFAIKNANERDALKADAERWKTIKPHFYFQFKGGQGFWNCSISSESWTVDGIIPDAAIDAMKGAT